MGTRTWTGGDRAEKWTHSERVWILIEDERDKLALCFVYLRVESTKSSPNYQKNQYLLDLIETELNELSTSGFKILIQGDLNAHVEIGENFTFNKYPHQINNNGTLVVKFATRNNLHCMNPMSWKGKKEDAYTFQRDMGTRVLQSIIDYGLGSTEIIDITTSFSVEDDGKFSAESDHSSLLWSFKMKSSPPSPPKQLNPMKLIRNWQSFTATLEKRLAPKLQLFQGLPCDDQGTFLGQEMVKVGNSVSPGTLDKGTTKLSSSRKIIGLLKIKKNLRTALKKIGFTRTPLVSDLRRKINTTSMAIRKQFFIDSLRRKKKVKAILENKGARAQKLLWELINPKNRSDLSIDALDQVIAHV